MKPVQRRTSSSSLLWRQPSAYAVLRTHGSSGRR